MPRRRKAADFFPPDEATEQAKNTEEAVEESGVDPGRVSEVRRSARLHSSPAAVEQPSSPRKAGRKSVLEMGQDAKKISPRIENTTPVPSISKAKKSSNESHNTNEIFDDTPKDQFATSRIFQRNASSVQSPLTDESFMTAMENIEDVTEDALILPGSQSNDLPAESTPKQSTQNTLDKIPSSQPRPRSQRSPVPLQPVTHSTPAASFPTSTSLSEDKSTLTSLHPQEVEQSDDASSNSDDEAPEPISLSQSRSQALESQSKISQQAKAQAEKAREKRRHRDRVFATQAQEKRTKTAQSIEEIPNSQQSTTTDINSGNTTDTPAPNQAHQAARIARHADALPSAVLQAASATWLQPDIPPPTQKTVERPKKRKERDDGIRILDDMNLQLAPKTGKIGVRKEKMIMRMGRGGRRMFIGRFTK
jgi:hypothetical protein